MSQGLVRLVRMSQHADGVTHAEDTIAGLTAVPGFVFAYAEASQPSRPDCVDRVVSLFRVTDTGGSLPRGQRYVWLPATLVSDLVKG